MVIARKRYLSSIIGNSYYFKGREIKDYGMGDAFMPILSEADYNRPTEKTNLRPLVGISVHRKTIQRVWR